MTIETERSALGAVTVAALIARCSTAARRQYQAMATGNRAAVQGLQACIAVLYDFPEFAPLQAHIALGVGRIS